MQASRFVVSACAFAMGIGVAGCGRPSTVETTVEQQAAPPATTGGTYEAGAAAAGSAAPSDYVAQHMRVRHQQFAADMVPDSALYHGYLAEGQEERFETVLQAGYCYRVIGVGGPQMADLDLWIVDENGNPIAQDTATDNFPVLGVGSDTICPRWTGPFYIRALAYRGFGEYGVQLFRTP